MISKEALIEKLAEIEHERWSAWHRHCRANWNVAMVSRWNEQAETPYSKLSESEKESDRKEVMRYWPLIEEYILEAKAYREVAVKWARMAQIETGEFDSGQNMAESAVSAEKQRLIDEWKKSETKEDK